MVRTAFRLRWLPRHVLALVLIAALILLGRWQWDVSESGRGGLQNLLYAFQWWAMAAMVVYGWWRLLRDDAYGRAAARVAPSRASLLLLSSSAEGDWDFPEFGQPDAFASLTAQTADDRDPDPELADYNDYLTRLNARSERAR